MKGQDSICCTQLTCALDMVPKMRQEKKRRKAAQAVAPASHGEGNRGRAASVSAVHLA
jgi:hypothetical protein